MKKYEIRSTLISENTTCLIHNFNIIIQAVPAHSRLCLGLQLKVHPGCLIDNCFRFNQCKLILACSTNLRVTGQVPQPLFVPPQLALSWAPDKFTVNMNLPKLEGLVSISTKVRFLGCLEVTIYQHMVKMYKNFHA